MNKALDIYCFFGWIVTALLVITHVIIHGWSGGMSFIALIAIVGCISYSGKELNEAG